MSIIHTHPVPYTTNPDKSVLCIGSVSQDRYNSLLSPTSFARSYEKLLKLVFHDLSAQGYDTYLFTSWDRFSILSALEIQRNKTEMQKCYRLSYVFLMGIFEASRPMEWSPSYLDFLDEVIWPQADDDLAADEVFDRVLNSVSAVVFDNQNDETFVRSILDKATALGKRMIDVNSANS